VARQIIVDILGNATGFTAATDQAAASAGRFQNLMTGIGQGLGISTFNIAQTAISDIGNTLAQSAQDARDDEASQSHLAATLRENLPAWDDNTTAIEKYIGQMEDATAFSKNDLRDSLSQLVGATHDLGKAQSDQAIAANLARYADESLGTATQQIVDVEAGRYRGLASLGINIKDVTTSQDALNQINNIAAGQSTKYLDTQNGQLELQNQLLVDQRVKLGEATAGWDLFATKLQTNFFAGLTGDNGFGGVTKDLTDVGNAAGNFAGLFATHMSKTTESLKSTGTAAKEWSNQVSGDLDASGNVADDVYGPGGTFDKAFTHTLASMGSFGSRAATDLQKGQDDITTASQALAAALVNPISAVTREKNIEDILQGKGSVGQQLLTGLKSSDPLVSAAAEKLQSDLVAELTGLEATYQLKFIQDRNTAANGGTPSTGGSGSSGGGGAKPPAPKPPAPKPPSGGTGGGGGGKTQAGGGEDEPGDVALVGEMGPELVEFGRAARVIPHDWLGSQGGSSKGTTVHVHFHDPVYADGPGIDRLVLAITRRVRFATGI